MCKRFTGHLCVKKSKHWFRQPSSNHCHSSSCHSSQKNVSWWTVFRWWLNGSKSVTDNSYQPFLFKTEHVAYTSTKKTKIIWIEMRTCVLGHYVALTQSSWYPNLSEGADHVSRQLCRDRVPLQWCNQFWLSLEEGAGKWCSTCDLMSFQTTEDIDGNAK